MTLAEIEVVMKLMKEMDFLGNENERRRIESQHEEEMARIKAMDNENERKAALQRFIEENNLKIKLEEIERSVKKDRMEHEERMEDLSIKREDMIEMRKNERSKDEEKHIRKLQKINDRHQERMDKLNIEKEKNQMDNNRLTEEMRINAENEKNRINNEHQREMQRNAKNE